MKSKITSEGFLIFLVTILAIDSYKNVVETINGLLHYRSGYYTLDYFNSATRILSVLIPTLLWYMLLTLHPRLLAIVRVYALFFLGMGLVCLYFVYSNWLLHNSGLAIKMFLYFIGFSMIAVILYKNASKYIIKQIAK